MNSVAATTIAGCFSLAAFAVAVAAGLLGGNPASSILFRAMLAMLVCYPIGFAVGVIAQRLVDEHIEAHKEANPELELLDDPTEGDGATASSSDEEVIVV